MALHFLSPSDDVAGTRRGLALAGLVSMVIGFGVASWVRAWIRDDLERSRNEILQTLEAEDSAVPEELGDSVKELRKKVSQLETDKARLSVLLGAMSEAVVMLDGLERILVANPMAEKLLGLTSPYSKRRLGEVTQMKRLTDIVSDVLWRQTATITEVDWPASHNDIRHLWVSVAPITSDDKDPAGVVVVMYDVTRLRRLERVRRDFVANVSHELRTPIATIQSSAETLLMDGMDVGPIGVEFVETIHRQSGRMGQIVEDLLTLSRLEAAGEELAMQNVEILVVAQDVLERFRPVAQKNGVSLEIEVPEDLPPVQAEPRALQQILANLVENGLKYTPEGGQVIIRATRRDSDVVITVEDNGIGISPEHVHRVFERFYRVDTGRSREVGGTGLGLAIAKHLVRRLGGDIVLESQPQKGSKFKFWLPAHEP
jgi:two-component system phosphate regulon sensor histidine kinase PhoR